MAEKNFVVYRSGAGSGKTFTLVKEYLRLALADEKKLRYTYRRILAITFTNKAAAEMKSRVVTALHELASDPDSSKMGKLLASELSISPEELARRSSIVLSHLLHNYSDFAIGTIDSFTHRLVRTFAQELNLPVNFNVELDSKAFYQRIISQLLSTVGEDQEVTSVLKELVLHRAEDNAAWDPEAGMQEFTNLLLKEDAPGYLERLAHLDQAALEQIRNRLLAFMKEYRTVLRTKGREAVDFISSHGLQQHDFFYKGSGPQNFFYKCAKAEANLNDASGKRISEAITRGKWFSSDFTTSEELVQALSSRAKELVDYIEQNYRHYTLFELLSKQMTSLMLLRKIEALGTRLKNEERIVFISEFNNRIFDIVRNEPAPFIYERLGERYQHFLIDEFQDTSTLQWLNLLSLLDNGLAAGWYSLVVGDGKQSIYRWRNANVKQFSALPDIQTEGGDENLLNERRQTLQRNFREQNLSRNYRSSSTIVDFNNRFFSILKGSLNLESLNEIYKGHEQEKVSGTTGFVTVDCGRVESSEAEEVNCNLVLERIQQALQDGYEYRDICVLARKNNQGNLVASFLVDQGIPVVSSDSLLLKNNAEVNTVLSYLRCLMNPNDMVSAAAIVTYLCNARQLSCEQYDELLKRISSGEPLEKVLLQAGLEKSKHPPINLYDHCLVIIKMLGVQKKAPDYIRFFLDEVNEFIVQQSGGAAAFLDWWEQRQEKASVIIPEGTDAVRIMTIHASKGLEFPVVIIPFCNWQIHRPEQVWVQVNSDKVELPVGVVKLSKKAAESGFSEEQLREQVNQIIDNVNLLYVAFTRAADRLHIISKSTTDGDKFVSDWIRNSSSFMEQRGEQLLVSGERKHKTSTEHKRQSVQVLNLEALSFDSDPEAIKIRKTVAAGSDSALGQGILLHELAAQLRTKDDVEKVIAEAILKGQLSTDQAGRVRTQLYSIIGHEKLRPFFEGKGLHRTEAELVTAGGEVLRPDRVIEFDNEIVILDYKTGQENKSKHEKQIRHYASALSEMGYSKIRKYLVYVDSMQVAEVQ